MSKLNFIKALLQFRKDNRGTSATEFAIMAPIFVVSMLAMVDFGMAFGTQMKLDQAVRTGAEFAIGGVNDKDTLKELVASAASGYGEQQATDVGKTRPVVAVDSVCRCPGSATVISCSATCSGLQPSRFFTISAAETHYPIFIPAIHLNAELQVQYQ